MTLTFSDIIDPDGKARFPRTKMTRFMIDTEARTALAHTLDDRPSEAPTVAPDSTGVPYKHAYMTTSSYYGEECDSWHEGCSTSPMHSLTKITIGSTALDAQVLEDSWVPSYDAFVEEPLFVKRPGATMEDDGWLISLVHQANGLGDAYTEVAILD